jgi:hypothetical protein
MIIQNPAAAGRLYVAFSDGPVAEWLPNPFDGWAAMKLQGIYQPPLGLLEWRGGWDKCNRLNAGHVGIGVWEH